MFDDQTVHIGNVKSAIGTGLQHGRTEPVVAGGKKLRLLLLWRPAALERDPIAFQQLTMDQVMDRLTDKNAVRKIWPE